MKARRGLPSSGQTAGEGGWKTLRSEPWACGYEDGMGPGCLCLAQGCFSGMGGRVWRAEGSQETREEAATLVQ